MAELVNAQLIWDMIINNVEPTENYIFSNDTEAALYELYKKMYTTGTAKKTGTFEVPEVPGDLLGDFVGASYVDGFFTREDSSSGVSILDSLLRIKGDEDYYNSIKNYNWIQLPGIDNTLYEKGVDYNIRYNALGYTELQFSDHIFSIISTDYEIYFGTNKSYACLHCEGNVVSQISNGQKVVLSGSSQNLYDGSYTLIDNPIFVDGVTLLPYSNIMVNPPFGYSFKGSIAKESTYGEIFIGHLFETMFIDTKFWVEDTGEKLPYLDALGANSTSSVYIKPEDFEAIALPFGAVIHYAIINLK